MCYHIYSIFLLRYSSLKDKFKIFKSLFKLVIKIKQSVRWIWFLTSELAYNITVQ